MVEPRAGGGRVNPGVVVKRRSPGDTHGLPRDLHPVLRRVYAARQVSSPRELERSLNYLQPHNELAGLDAAVDLLAAAVSAGQRMLIVGDFDADGATSCAVAMRALHAMGASQVDFLVPDRFRYGYGLTPEIVAVAAKRQPDIIITVDNGISSLAGVEAAQARGIQVVITDHHLPGQRLPPADAIVNPNQLDCPFPSKHLAGVGVIFYVMLGLRARLRQAGWFHGAVAEPNLAQLLDLVALGTVADVVPLDHNNRILVAQGLSRIRRGQACPGVQALLAVGGRDPRRVVAADLGFVVGPRLNAAGRLDDMSQGIACLLADDEATAQSLAHGLDALNRQRRAIEDQMKTEALAHLDNLQLEGDLPVGLCLFDEHWHQGVIGILASRVKDRLHRPVIAFAPGEDDELKGSARSVSGCHVRDALEAVAARYPALIRKFGGHAMAAGLTIRRSEYAAFSTAFDTEVRRHLDADDLAGVVLSDGELAPEELAVPVAEALRAGGPWGQGFPEPVFDGYFQVLDRRVVGERHLKMQLQPFGAQRAVDAIAFHCSEEACPPGTAHVHIAYKLDINEYRGTRSAQLLVEHIEPQG